MLDFSHQFADVLPDLSLPWQGAPAPGPHLVKLNTGLADELGLVSAQLGTPECLEMLLGLRTAPGSKPVAQAYAGHQFGGYSPRLGDGRALLLGELTTPDGALVDLHLKGSGRTPFSRGGDGYAALGPMLREYLMGEAMHALGIPTTRALAVLGTGRRIVRETSLPGAVLARVASSHLRVGTFQYARASGDLALLRRTADYAIARHYAYLSHTPEPYLGLLGEVAAAQARLIAQWLLVGFVHGVMNTDNMTISGQTIDYGPCAFLEIYDPVAVFSSIDHEGRYAFGRQPDAALWNLARFAETLLPLIDDDLDTAIAAANGVMEQFPVLYRRHWHAGMSAKLGLSQAPPTLMDDLLGLLARQVDYTSFFVALTREAASQEVDQASARPRDLVMDQQSFDAWQIRWLALRPDAAIMASANPIYIARNHLVEEALDAATAGDLAPFERLLGAVSRPFSVRPGLERYSQPAPDSFGRYVTYCGT